VEYRNIPLLFFKFAPKYHLNAQNQSKWAEEIIVPKEVKLQLEATELAVLKKLETQKQKERKTQKSFPITY
jgi:hypothetical protein